MRAAAAVLCLLIATSAAAAPRGASATAPRRASATVPGRAPAPAPRDWDEKRIGLPRVGSGVAYIPHTPTPHVVLLVSGTDGWNNRMVDTARRMAAQAVVIGINYAALKRTAARESGCWYMASEFELISHAAQKLLKLPQYHAPILIGYGEGGAAVYAALAGGPATTFAGGISIGFCPSIASKREVCSGDTWSPDYDDRKHLNVLPPSKTLPREWYVLSGPRNPACPPDAARAFVVGLPNAHAAGEDAFDKSLQDLWTEKEVKPAAAQPRSATTRELEDELQRLQLPLELRWPSTPMTALLVFFSGDGGWASLDEEVAEHLVARGVGIVGVSSLRYFWQAKPPATVGADIRRLTTVLTHAAKPIFAGGFSFGAEVVPVALKEWTAADRRALAGLALIAPGTSASFEIDPLDWIRTPRENPETRVAPAIRTDAVPTVCIAGADEEDSACAALNGVPTVRVVRLPGSHHFNSDYTAVGEAVAQFIRSVSERRP